MPDTLTKLAYQAFQDGKNYFGLGHKAIATQLRQWLRPGIKIEIDSITPEFLEEITRRRDALLEIDWQDAEAGVYSTSLLFDNPWADFFQYYPAIWLDLPAMWDRVEARQRAVEAKSDRSQHQPFKQRRPKTVFSGKMRSRLQHV